ncbi:DNA cytosine methyltransferase [Arenimonas sp.]|uniref:DNA cytosine methyltransferase n=1 Tax=Arenimonas sp. TaxID=1872635 RepID=UPI0037BE923C
MNHIELFAGCGGMSLGLERAGFKLIFANELSPMAAESFAFNFLGEDLERLANLNEFPKNVIWISSNYKSLKSRLRENPFTFPEPSKEVYKDFSLNNKLVIGNIIHLNKILLKNKKILQEITINGDVDLVSGGPPCQSFSMAGLRQKDSDKNRLPWEFATFVGLVKPRIAVLENVSGILHAFRDDDEEFYAWFEVAKAFAKKGYIPLCLHLNARYVGVPQNRPRFLMISIRADLYPRMIKKFNNEELSLFDSSFAFYKNINEGKQVVIDDLVCFDVTNKDHLGLYKKSFLSEFVSAKNEVSVKDALDDLKFNSSSDKSAFVESLNKLFKRSASSENLRNHEPRSNNELVKRRFRLYQVLSGCSKGVSKEVVSILKGISFSLSGEAWGELKNELFLMESGKLSKFKQKSEFESFLTNHGTKKLTQKALKSGSPASAALSIPDDVCHYDSQELRTLTVREMARIQSFPDGFVFKSKVTTGGQMRKYEVPQYTQVGNAVPPLLGFAIGSVVKRLLDKIE